MTYTELKEQLIQASDEYYKNNNSIMTDYEFDMKLKELERMEEEQGYRDSDSPTIRPGSDLTERNEDNKHGRPMMSLKNGYSIDDIKKWFEDIQKETGLKNPEILVNPKWDGGSGALRFDSRGELYKGLTRGDGEYGEDITQNIKYCADNIWAPKRSYGMPFSGEVRGEIIMTDAGFKAINDSSEKKYQNARNLVSGSLKILDIYEFIPRADSIKFYAYWLEDSENSTYSADLQTLKMYGFDVGPYYICNSIEKIEETLKKIEDAKYDVAIDGAVLKLNQKKYWKQIGNTSKYPKWAIAYKYKQESVETKITKIEFQTGRSGKVTPLAYFEPRFIDGSTIQKATVNNKEFYDAMDIAIGDIIEVHKAAAIIPQIIGVNERPDTRIKVPFPTNCPSCGSKLRKHNEEHTDLFCDNDSCKSRIVDKIINYTHSIECDGFAEAVVERLHNAGILNSISDLYRLKDHKALISTLERLSENMANKLCDNIENSKSAEFWKVLAGLGIPNVGPKTAKILANQFKSIVALEGATQIELEMVDDIAEITAKSIKKWFTDNHKLIRELEEFGVNMSVEILDEDDKPQIDLDGKAFCITGALSLKRDTYIELIEACGGKVTGSVTSKTSYLITNDKTSGTTKNKKAQELGIPILNEKELLEMCNALNLLKEIGVD